MRFEPEAPTSETDLPSADTAADMTGQAGQAGEAGPESRIDFLQLAFWACMLGAIAAASVSLVWPNASGLPGSILLFAMASGGLVFLLWTVRGAGRYIGLFPERGAAARAIKAATPRFPWIEALDEAVLVAETGGASVIANQAYRELTALMLMTGADESKPVTVDRLFGANPGLAAPVYRLSKAATTGTMRREVLPPVAVGPEQVPAQFEVTVSPLSRGRVLWRLRRITGEAAATGAADLKSLYIEEAPLGFFTARPDGTVTYANAWLRELLGLAETAKNIRTDDIMRPEFVKLLARDRKSGAPGRADIQLRGRDGVEIPVHTITNWTGRGIEAVGRTIVMANTPLAGSEGRQLLATASRPPRPDSDPMFDDAPFGAVRLAGDRVDCATILDSNRALMEVTAGAATPGSSFVSLFASAEDEAPVETLLPDAVHKPVTLKTRGPAPRDVNVFVTLDTMGRPSVAYVIDVTEQRLLEQRLAHGEKMQSVGTLAGKIAHEINNMLQGIFFNYEALIVRHPAGDPSFDNLKAIHEFSVRCKELVRGLLAYARAQTFKREIFNMTDLLSEFSILMRQILDERIELDIHHGRDLPWLKADKYQIETAIINLATNARDAMIAHKKGGKLTIRTSRVSAQDAHAKGFDYVELGEYLLVEVSDTGHGMPRDVLDKIFQPFFTTKEQGAGTGLGLATVYGIIKQSGGYICPVSAVGKGTTFYIYLPALPAEEVPAPADVSMLQTASQRPMDMSGRGRILLIEDEDGVRSIAATHLRSCGYTVEEACDGEDAFDILKESPGAFDLVISDVVMPGMDGPSLIREARDLLGRARVIFISGYAERDIAQQLDDDIDVSFLPKPFSVRQLAERIKTELASAARDAA